MDPSLNPRGASRHVAVTGASGNVGGAVVARLLDAGADVAAIVRDPAKVKQNGSLSTRRADYADRAGLIAVMDGVRTLVFIPSDGEAAAMLAHHLNIIAAAKAAGVDRIVYLSIVDIEEDSPFCYATVHRETEARLMESGIPHSVIRASLYSEFFLRWVLEAASTHVLQLPSGPGRMSLVSRDDVAEGLAAVALSGAGGGIRAVTGNRALDLSDVAAMTGELTGNTVSMDDVGLHQFFVQQAQDGLDRWWAYAFTTMFESIHQQRFDVVTDSVQEITGRPPAPFIETVRTALHKR